MSKKEYSVEVEHSEKFYEQTKIVNDLIRHLPITVEENNKLIKELVKHTNIVEDDAFIFGFKLGRDFERWQEVQFEDKDNISE